MLVFALRTRKNENRQERMQVAADSGLVGGVEKAVRGFGNSPMVSCFPGFLGSGRCVHSPFMVLSGLSGGATGTGNSYLSGNEKDGSFYLTSSSLL